MSNNGEMKTGPAKIVDAAGRPMAPTPPTDTELLDDISEEEKSTREKTTTIDPRRMSTDLLLYNLMRSTITEVSLGQQLQQVAFMKKQKSHIGDLPGEPEVRQMLQNCQAHRTILSHVARERFKDFDAAYFARIGVEPYMPPVIEIEDMTGDDMGPEPSAEG